MSSLLNIPSYITGDINYRYKMPRLTARIEGRGNGIRTNVVNMADIAKALKIPPYYPTKFCGYELGAQSKFDPAEGKAIINGSHDQKDLQTLIDKFIDKYVLCEKCKLPEIYLGLKKSRVGYSCNACGFQGSVDQNHKLTTFIMKNPPEVNESTLGTQKKKIKEKSLKPKPSKISDIKDDDQLSDSLQIVSKKKNKKNKQKLGSPKEANETETDNNHVNISHEAHKDNNNEKNENSDSFTDNKDEVSKNDVKFKEKNNKQVVELTYDSPEIIDAVEKLTNILTHLIKSEDPSYYFQNCITADVLYNQLLVVQSSYNLSLSLRFYVALLSVFSIRLGGFTLEKLDKYIFLFSKIINEMTSEDKITVVEHFVDYLDKNKDIYKEKESFYVMYPYILHKLYFGDILDEMFITQHYSPTRNIEENSSIPFKKAYHSSKPFVKWLMNDGSNDEKNITSSKETDMG